VAEFSNALSWLGYIMVGQEKALGRLRWPRRLELSSQDIEVLGRSRIVITITCTCTHDLHRFIIPVSFSRYLANQTFWAWPQINCEWD
jgi:hypothetical protein